MSQRGSKNQEGGFQKAQDDKERPQIRSYKATVRNSFNGSMGQGQVSEGGELKGA